MTIKLKTKYAIVISIMMITFSMFLGFKLGDGGYKGELHNSELDQYKQAEKFLLRTIDNQHQKLVESAFRYDSLNEVIADIDKKRETNYKLYKNEVKRNEEVLTIGDAWIANDSILRAAGIRR